MRKEFEESPICPVFWRGLKDTALSSGCFEALEGSRTPLQRCCEDARVVWKLPRGAGGIPLSQLWAASLRSACGECSKTWSGGASPHLGLEFGTGLGIPMLRARAVLCCCF